MTEIEYQEFVRRCPYDAMGDYSMFRKQQTENKSECIQCKSQNDIPLRVKFDQNVDTIIRLLYSLIYQIPYNPLSYTQEADNSARLFRSDKNSEKNYTKGKVGERTA